MRVKVTKACESLILRWEIWCGSEEDKKYFYETSLPLKSWAIKYAKKLSKLTYEQYLFAKRDEIIFENGDLKL